MEEIKDNSAQHWLDELSYSKKELKTWESRGQKIVERYKDDRRESDTSKRYNILWSNVQTIFPAVYSKKPKAQCDRRYKDADPIGRTAASIIERCLQFEIDHYNDYNSSIKNSLLDRLLVGRGVSWVRYEKSGQLTEDIEKGQETEIEVTESQDVESYEEYSPCDYVFWKDFRHSVARTWEEVTWVARRVYMTRSEGKQRFGDDFQNVSLSHVPVGLEEMEGTKKENAKKAVVWEIWDKATKQALWVAEGYQDILDQRDDPLGLDCFFPCPKPLFSTLTTDSLLPIADFLFYQDQAKELDLVTDRINSLVESCRLVGVYDAENTSIARMLNGNSNDLIPVQSWAAFSEKGGMKGAIDWLPLDMVIATINNLYIAREQCKQVIYEITGMSDIIRGSSNAQETATAQQIKSNFASLRLKDIQTSLAMFASELLKIKAQIICKFYQPETIMQMSGIMGTPDAQFAPQAIELLKNSTLRDFRIDIESDSMVELDERGEQQARTEFLAAVGGFLEKALQAPPDLAPLMGEMLLFGVRGFRVGRDIENSFDEAMAKMKEPKEPQQPPPDPAQIKAQTDMQMQQMQMQADAQKSQMEAQLHQQELAMQAQVSSQEQQLQYAIEAQRNEMEMQRQLQQQQHESVLEQMRLESERQTKILLAQIDRITKIETAEISAQIAIDQAQINAANMSVDGDSDGS